MCIAIPMRLVEIDGTSGIVESDGIKRRISLILLENPRPGDYLIIHAGCAINRIDEKAALETLKDIETIKTSYPPP